MFYFYLRFTNYFFTIFGVKKPFLLPSGNPNQITIWNKLWTVIISGVLITSFILTEGIQLSIPKSGKNIKKYDNLNQMIVNVIILVLSLVNDEKKCIKLYEYIEKVLHDVKIVGKNLKNMTIKLYLGLATTTALLFILVIIEIIYSDSNIQLISLPTYIATFHLVSHLCILLAILKIVSLKLTDMLTIDKNTLYDILIKQKPTKWKLVKYFISPEMGFLENDCKEHVELKFLSRIYHDLNTCIQLLEQQHGVQMLLTFWLMFTKAVFGITMIVCNITDLPVLMLARSIIPFIWCFYGCYINGEISKQVEYIDTLIVKYMIDFRCDNSRKATLQTFKQLVATNRLQFTACGLFHLNFSMLLGTIVNVITYSIILIQLFLSDNK